VIRDANGNELARYCEAAAGSASGPATMLGDHHDNALKTAASDALKRCAINLGTQFGLGLYDKGSTAEVVMGTLVKPEGVKTEKEVTEEQIENLQKTLGAQVLETEEHQDNGVQQAQREVGAKLETERRQRVEQRDNGGPPPESGPAVELLDPRSDLARAMHAQMDQAKVGDAREERLAYVCEVIGRTVESSAKMTVTEAHKVIDAATKKTAALRAGAPT
jgi:recombination DNA repair RAD52 pathway protein